MSLQDQLLKAGLVDSKKAKQANKDKRKQDKVQRKSKQGIVDQNKLDAQKKREDKAQRDRELAKQHNAEAEKKAVQAQIIQLIKMNRQEKNSGDLNFNFTDNKKVKTLYVNQQQHKELSRGRLVVALLAGEYELIPAVVADKIAQRDESSLVFRSEQSSAVDDNEPDDDPYADFQIPDDLVW